MREMAKTDTALGKQVKARIEAGILVEDEIVAEVLEKKLAAFPAQEPLILDSFPRTLPQYQMLQRFWPALKRGDYRAIFLELSEEAAVKRLGNRYTCEKCEAIYVGVQSGPCPKCGGKIVQREDDRPAAIAKRLQMFNSQTLPMVAALERDGKVIRIDGAPAIEEVHQEILNKLGLS